MGGTDSFNPALGSPLSNLKSLKSAKNTLLQFHLSHPTLRMTAIGTDPEKGPHHINHMRWNVHSYHIPRVLSHKSSVY